MVYEEAVLNESSHERCFKGSVEVRCFNFYHGEHKTCFFWRGWANQVMRSKLKSPVAADDVLWSLWNFWSFDRMWWEAWIFFFFFNFLVALIFFCHLLNQRIKLYCCHSFDLLIHLWLRHLFEKSYQKRYLWKVYIYFMNWPYKYSIYPFA